MLFENKFTLYEQRRAGGAGPNGRAGLIMRYNESIQDWNGYLHNEIGTTLIDASTGRVY